MYSNLQIAFYQLENVMAVEWNAHRFSGGALALDVANTVVLRVDPTRCFDRFADPHEIGRFAEAAEVMRADELRGRRLIVDGEDAAGETYLVSQDGRVFRVDGAAD